MTQFTNGQITHWFFNIIILFWYPKDKTRLSCENASTTQASFSFITRRCACFMTSRKNRSSLIYHHFSWERKSTQTGRTLERTDHQRTATTLCSSLSLSTLWIYQETSNRGREDNHACIDRRDERTERCTSHQNS